MASRWLPVVSLSLTLSLYIFQLRKRYAEQAEEIKQLKNMLNIKEQRIRELEDQLDNVLKNQNESVA